MQDFNIVPIYIAYAEDHSLVREVLIKRLENEQRLHFIIEVSNGQELIEAIEKSAIMPDICLLDIKMPVMNGFEVASIINKRWPDMKILVLSAYDSESFQSRMLDCGAHAFINKRTKSQEIKNALILLHENKIYGHELFPGYFTHSMKRQSKNAITFTALEQQLLKYSAEERSLEEIAGILKVSPKSIEAFRYKLYKKLGLKSRIGLVMYAIKNGFVI